MNELASAEIDGRAPQLPGEPDVAAPCHRHGPRDAGVGAAKAARPQVRTMAIEPGEEDVDRSTTG
jgi:hypothetical protein